MRSQFLIEWLLANMAALLVGSLLGATDGGLVHGIPGDLLLGGSVGAAQWWVLRRHLGDRPGLWWWLPATALGYAAGVVLGRRFAHMIATEHLLVGFVFGVFVGTLLGLGQAAALRRFHQNNWTAIRWFVTTLAAWVAAEVTAFIFYFRLEGVPFVGLAVGLVSGLALLALMPSMTGAFGGYSIPEQN